MFNKHTSLYTYLEDHNAETTTDPTTYTDGLAARQSQQNRPKQPKIKCLSSSTNYLDDITSEPSYYQITQSQY